ncbi:MAG: methyltransferase domain-containing protein [Vicinamibacterales bacterium]
MNPAGRDAAFIEQAYWLLLGRAPSTLEAAEDQRRHLNSDQVGLGHGLLHSREFRRLRSAWRSGRETHDDAAGLETVLVRLFTPELFVQRLYELILGRAPDEAGARHYAAVLAAGERRVNIVRAIALSDECGRRFAAVPQDTQLCELANPAKWDNDEWLDLLRSLGLTDDKLAMHRKPYEFTQMLYGARRLGLLHEESSFISIGAGHEQVLYWLANHVGRVVATDMYEGVWQGERAREGDPTVLVDPDLYAPFPYRRDRLEFMKMDGRDLRFPDGTFDVAYSLSSIEHFGGTAGAGQTMREMARVLKPGGVLAIATEYVLSGPSCDETFQPSEIRDLIAMSGLDLVEPIDERVWHRYQTRPVRLDVDPYQSPHMLVQLGDTVFTSVMFFLRKPPSASPA